MKSKEKTPISISLWFIWKGVLSIFRPSYDEKTLFLIALTSTLLLIQYHNADEVIGFVFAKPTITSPDLINPREGFSHDPRISYFFFIVIAIIGYGLSILHAFTLREKAPLKKWLWPLSQ